MGQRRSPPRWAPPSTPFDPHPALGYKRIGVHPAVRTFLNTEAFYADDPRRAHSGELDFGVHWRDQTDWLTYRISLVLDTRELYAVCLQDGPVELLATFTAHDDGGRHEAETTLEGWAYMCGLVGSMEWARRRASTHTGGHPVTVAEVPKQRVGGRTGVRDRGARQRGTQATPRSTPPLT